MTTEHIHRFSFGDNWEKFSRTVSQDKIDEAVENLKRVTGEQTLAGNSFLDIGCGSGLHALAAIKLAAASVTAFDIDPQSVQTTKNILAAYAPGMAVNVEQKDILSATADNGKKYDIVYSWGVLHHTGNMWVDVSRPKVPPPPDACDTHAHVFGPEERFPYAEDRSYTPPDAPLEKYLGMLDAIGFARGVLVQGSAHGRDNSAMLDALSRRPDRLRGVAVADADIAPATLRE